MVRKVGIEDSVRFLGVRDDVPRIVNSFDVLVFPSLYEGISLALIEAQANGLPVLASDAVSGESLLLSSAESMPLGSPIGDWADAVIRLSRTGRMEGAIAVLSDAGYEIRRAAEELAGSYLALYANALHDGGRSCE